MPSPLALTSSAFLLAATSPEAASSAATVTVSFNPNSRRISVSADPVVISPGQTIDWTSASGVEALAIDIPSSKEPFGQSVRMNGVRTRKGGPPAHVQANSDPSVKGTYKYTVAVYDGTQVWILDPDIIIN